MEYKILKVIIMNFHYSLEIKLLPGAGLYFENQIKYLMEICQQVSKVTIKDMLGNFHIFEHKTY